jgi:tetratricopeptide (TPR) repeat protein
MNKTSLSVIGFAWLLFGCPLSANAQKKKPTPPVTVAPEGDFAKAKALFERGEAFYRLGEYEKALAEYREAYLVSHAPLLLLNIAQCYRYLSEYEEAKHNYEAFIREDPKSPYRKEMENKIAEMETILEAQRRDADKTPTALVVTVKGSTEEPKKLKPWMLGTGIGAIVLGGSALTFLLLTNNQEKPQTSIGGQFVPFKGVP